MRSLPASEAVLRNMKIAETARGVKADGHPTTNGVNLEAEIAILRRQLLQATVENSRKDSMIESLERRLKVSDSTDEQLATPLRNSFSSPMGSRRSLNSLTSAKKAQSNWSLTTSGGSNRTTRTSLGSTGGAEGEGKQDNTDKVVEEIQGWLFMEGGKLRDVDSLLTRYCELCRKHGVPLDRLFVAGMMMHPHTSACVWKWELGCEFTEDVVPPEAFEPQNFNEDEPFAVLMQGKAMEYRMTRKSKIPAGCDWFVDGGYQDYYALPMYHNGQFKGAMAWSTKSRYHFSDDHHRIFTQSIGALSTVLRLYANDLVIDNAMLRLEEAVQAQTSMLASANAELELANRKIVDQAQKQLKHFAMMSHEIRTPLNCIVGISNLMLDSCEDENMRESIEMITSSGDLLLAVVDDVLDYSKLAAGKVETKIAPTKLSVPINTVETSIRTKARENGLELRAKYSPDLPEYVVTDARRLQQILYNLLGNAAKFGNTGKYIDFSVALEPTDPNFIRFSIKDYGKGIAPNELNNVFEPFRQLASNQPSHGGTGLGLAITRQLVRALGGSVQVQSDFGNWCEFTVCLPCDSGNPTPMGQSSVPATTMEHDNSQSTENSEDYDSDDDSSFDSFGLSSTTSFQGLLHEAARRQAVGMGGDIRNQEMNPLAPTAVASLHKLRTQLLSSSSLKSGTSGGSHSSSIGFSSNGRGGSNSSTSTTSMRNVQFQTSGLDSFAGRTGSFNQLSSQVPLGRSRNKLSSKSLKSVGSRSAKNRKRPVTSGSGGINGGSGRSSGSTSKTKRRGSSSTKSSKRRGSSSTKSSKRRGSGITGGTISLVGVVDDIIPESKTIKKIHKGTPAQSEKEKAKASKCSKAKEKNKERSKEESKAEEAGVNPMARIKVLVAEDNKINQKVLKRTLMRVGIDEGILDIVENGKLAVEASEEKAYDIIFMDMQMPIMDGLEATSIISKRAIHPKIVFLTAHALPEYQEKAIEAGGDCFISKPFKLDSIRNIIQELVLGDDESEEEL